MASRLLRGLSSAAAVQRALDEFAGIGREAFLLRYGFGKAKEFFVRNPVTGELADSKAIAGAAYGYQYADQGPLKAEDFSGGERTVVAVLGALGFEVVGNAGEGGEDWSRDEVDAIVSDYLAMLTLELTGQPYNKAARRRALMPRLRNRSEGAIEFKHCNISAVMGDLGFPSLKGYKPRSNTQRRMLVDVVSEQVQRYQLLDEAALAAVQRPAQAVEPLDFSKVKTDAPRCEPRMAEPSHGYAAPVRRDYLEREARNRSLGQAGEDFVVRFERWRLGSMGAGQLAEKVEPVAQSRGDGLGYDVLSFQADGRELFIEVKTTAFGEMTPFFVSANEARFARDNETQFRLYRLFDFRAAPRLFELAGAIERHCMLDAATFRASFR
jgi:hypothetical protein